MNVNASSSHQKTMRGRPADMFNPKEHDIYEFHATTQNDSSTLHSTSTRQNDSAQVNTTRRKRKNTNDESVRQHSEDIQMSAFFHNASLNADSTDEEGIRSTVPAYDHQHKNTNRKSNSERNQIKTTSLESTQGVDEVTKPDSNGKRRRKTEGKSSDAPITCQDTLHGTIVPMNDHLDSNGYGVKKYKSTNTSQHNKGNGSNSIDFRMTQMKRSNFDLSTTQPSKRKTKDNGFTDLADCYITDNENQDTFHEESDYGEDSEEDTMKKLVPGYPQNKRSLTNPRRKSAKEIQDINSRSNEEVEMMIYGNVSSQSTEMVEESSGSQQRFNKSNAKKSSNAQTAKNRSTNNSTTIRRPSQTAGDEHSNLDDHWNEDQLDKFLDTLAEQPTKEMNDTCNKWVMFAKRLQQKGVNKNNEQCRKQVTNNTFKATKNELVFSIYKYYKY